MKRRITLVVDEDERARMGGGPFPESGWGVTIESDEVIPEPDRVQEFRVRIVTKAKDDPIFVGELRGWIQPPRASYRIKDVAVTEVQS